MLYGNIPIVAKEGLSTIIVKGVRPNGAMGDEAIEVSEPIIDPCLVEVYMLRAIYKLIRRSGEPLLIQVSERAFNDLSIVVPLQDYLDALISAPTLTKGSLLK